MIVICFDVYMYKAGKDGLIGDNCELCPEMYFGQAPHYNLIVRKVNATTLLDVYNLLLKVYMDDFV